MNSTLLSGPRHDWLVMGSNGSIGSELTAALFRSALVDPSGPVVIHTHSSDVYGQVGLDLLRGRSAGRPLWLLFCGGKGGFSLPESSANQQHQAFSEFCMKLGDLNGLDKFIFVSSLGVHCSGSDVPYVRLVAANEQAVQHGFGERSLILRLPSLYGFNAFSQRFHGLIGVVLQNLRLRKDTTIYARLETRRNYLSTRKLARELVMERPGGSWLEQNGCLNCQAAVSLSIHDICTSFFRAIHQRPVLRLVRHACVDAEHHFPRAVEGVKVVINDSLSEWLKWQWIGPAH